MELGCSNDFFSGVDIRWWFLIWGDNNLGIQRNTRIWYFALYFVCRLFYKLPGCFYPWLLSFFLSFFLSSNTTKAFSFSLSSPSGRQNQHFLSSCSSPGFCVVNLKFAESFAGHVFDCHKCIRLIYVDVCCWCHRSHVLWIMVWCLLTLSKSKPILLRTKFATKLTFDGNLKSGRRKLYILARW